MKKVILCALVLAVHGVLLNSVLAQEDRYLVTYVRSSTLTATRSATVVTVINQSNSPCNVHVEWFVRSPMTNRLELACTQNQPLAPGDARQFCSRGLPNSITLCDTLVCDPELTNQQNQGKAIVSSTAEFACSLIAVEARVYYTTGINDTALLAISNSKIVFAEEGNLGD